MKKFAKMVLAVIVGLVVFGIFKWMVIAGIIGSLGSESQPVLPKSGILQVDFMSTVITEQKPSSLTRMMPVSAQPVSAVGLYEAVEAIKAAAADPAIKCIYLRTDGNMCSPAILEELRIALSDFRKLSGKPVVAYMEAPTTGSYYLSSVCDKVYMTSHPGATTMINGISSQMVFLGDLLDKFGVKVQLIRHGKFKSAGEMFTRNSSSQENREQNQRMVDAMWDAMAAQIAESRGISVESLNEAIDGLKLCEPADFLNEGLVDQILTDSELREKLAVLAGVERFKDVKAINLDSYIKSKVVTGKAKKKIAVIYANGEIVDGNVRMNVSGSRFSDIISEVRRDSSVKAVVLRVNSPGGSVLSSEKIKSELDLLKQDKPLVASYGDYAASGGYWISANCDKIFSDALTLTGSIGVFGMIPDFSGTLKKYNVGMETVSSSRHGDMYGLTRALDSQEYAYILKSIESIYTRFTDIVSQARGLSVERVDEIGQGRVWAGTDALANKLVDEIGTLQDAIRYAAVAAGDPALEDWSIAEFPKVEDTFESIMELFGGDTSDQSPVVEVFRNIREPRIVARLPYEIELSR